MPKTRVVSLIASSTEIVCALGAQDYLVGRSHECDYPPSVKDLPQVTETKFVTDGKSYQIHERILAILQEGLSVYRVDANKLRKLEPDVILTQTQCEVCAVSERDVEEATKTCLSLNTKIVSLHTNCISDLYSDIEKVATALHLQKEGQALVQRLKTGFESLKGQANPTGQPLSLACIEWIAPLMTSGNWMPELVSLVGLKNLFGTAGHHSPMLNLEDLVAADPDMIAIFPCGFSIARTLEEWPILAQNHVFRGLRAFRQKTVFICDGNQYFNRPGPRLLDTAKILVELSRATQALMSSKPIPETQFQESQFKDGWIQAPFF